MYSAQPSAISASASSSFCRFSAISASASASSLRPTRPQSRRTRSFRSGNSRRAAPGSTPLRSYRSYSHFEILQMNPIFFSPFRGNLIHQHNYRLIYATRKMTKPLFLIECFSLSLYLLFRIFPSFFPQFFIRNLFKAILHKLQHICLFDTFNL